MFDIIANAILSGMAGLVAYEIISEVRGGSGKLHDRYHD